MHDVVVQKWINFTNENVNLMNNIFVKQIHCCLKKCFINGVFTGKFVVSTV